MASYAATVAIKTRQHEKLGVGQVGMIRGTINVTNYNQTTAAITGVTKHFRDEPVVILSSISSLGYWGTWVDGTSDTVKCFLGDYNNGTDGPAIEVGNDVNVGVFNFVAFGRVA